MAVLIKGINGLPKTCAECPIYDCEYLRCNITNTEPWQGHEDDDVVPIPSDCPLIEIPDVYIDISKAFMTELCNKVCREEKDG